MAQKEIDPATQNFTGIQDMETCEMNVPGIGRCVVNKADVPSYEAKGGKLIGDNSSSEATPEATAEGESEEAPRRGRGSRG